MTHRALLSLVLSVVVLGCAPDPKVVVQRTATDVKSLVREAWVASESSNNWATLDSSLLALGVTAETRASSARVPPVSSLDTSLEPLNKRLEAIFAEANIVDRTGGALTFQVRGVDVCTDDNGALDAACSESVDKSKLFIRAAGDLDLTLLIGDTKAEAFTVEIRANVSIAVIVDLEKSIAAVKALQEAQSGTAVTSDYNAKGKIEWRLVKNGKDDFTLSTAVLAPVSYEMSGSDGVTRSASIGVKNPLASLRFEGPAKRATLQYGYGEVRYTGLLRDYFTTETTSARPLDVFLAGAGFSLIFEDGKNARLEGVGLGNATSTVKSGDDLLFSIDFNKTQGRTVSATWEPTTEGFKLNFTPGLELDAHLGLGAIESQTYVVKPEHRNATYSASFLAAGSTPSVEFFKERPTEQSPFARLLSGELKLSVDDPNLAPRSFEAPACLGSASGTLTNAYLESVVSVSCP